MIVAAKVLIVHIATAASSLEKRRPMIAARPHMTNTIADANGIEKIRSAS
jgi:hypothetical protein